jgi:hypothetical protein
MLPPEGKHQQREKARRQDIHDAIEHLKAFVGVKPTKVVIKNISAIASMPVSPWVPIGIDT